MIRVEEITIKEFRGIRDLTLSPRRGNFAICGPNGTGKSGVVDALEFALTGDISRLAGTGMGKISVKQHGPHVDSKDNPEKSSVTLKLFVPSLNKTVTIQRTAKNASEVQISPDSPDVRRFLDEVTQHPEFALSRREIIKYIIAEPGKRDEDVRALLRLDKLGVVRARLQSIANSAKKSAGALESAREIASKELAAAMQIEKVSADTILAAANKRRAILSLPALEKLDVKTSLTDGMAEQSAEAASEKIQKAAAIADMKLLNGYIEAISGKPHQDACATAIAALTALEGEEVGKEGAARHDLLQQALRMYDEETCPVCGTEWDAAEFRAHIAENLKKLEATTKKRDAAVQQLELIAAELEKLASALRPVFKYAGLLPAPIKPDNIAAFGKLAAAAAVQLRKFAPIAASIQCLNETKVLPKALLAEIKEIGDAINKLPEASAEDAARKYLIIAQERLEKLYAATAEAKKGKKESDTAAAVLEIYNTEVTEALGKIYKDVEDLFKDLYRFINDDESEFTANLIPSSGKLGFDVDFYGRGHFPPGAYHSEGHQDAMGLCLYLALMKHLMGENFTFAVLDDVLMSVDTGHRREVSKMLKEKFPNTQFILTTHDDVWLRAMKSNGLINGGQFVRFRKWSVDFGPSEWDDRDVWKEIDDYLAQNDVQIAAALLRNYLEHAAYEACDALRAQVEFHGDGQYMLGDLMPGAIGALCKRLDAAVASAGSWDDEATETSLNTLLGEFKKAIHASNVEQWQINTAVHYNAWANLGKQDFQPVVQAFKQLLSFFSCQHCQGLLYVLPGSHRPETLKCGCPKTNINLLTKPKEAKKGAA